MEPKDEKNSPPAYDEVTEQKRLSFMPIDSGRTG